MDASKASLICAALCCVVATCVEAAVPLRSRTTCLDGQTQKVYSLGDTWFTGGDRECMKLTCDGEDTISGLTCALFTVPSWCTVKPGNPKGVYPDCCPTPVCPEENAIEGSSSSSSTPPSDAAYAPYAAYAAYAAWPKKDRHAAAYRDYRRDYRSARYYPYAPPAL